jgi:anti-sigma-K factor RskA
MDERSEELAALNALGMLESDEKRVLDGTSLSDRDLRDLTLELEVAAAELGRVVAPMDPPADMKRRIRAKIRERSGSWLSSMSPAALVGGIGWAAAAVLAVSTALLWRERADLTRQFSALHQAITPATPQADTQAPRNLEDELKKIREDFESKKTTLSAEIDSLRKRESDANAKVSQLITEAQIQKEREATMTMQIVTLQSEVWEYRRSTMIVVWDGSRRQGALILDKMPRAESGRDYQLWVVDPKKPNPVSAGVVAVDDKGAAKVSFKPVEDVGDTVKFALSVEKKGGVPKKEGPIVLGGP